MNYLEVAELVGTWFTTPTIIFSLIVVFLWGPKCWGILRDGGPKDAAEWFIVGVAIGFLGESLDNIYWNIPWSLTFIHSDLATWWHSHGVIANLPFRQGAGIIAAYCHIKSFVLHSKDNDVQDNLIKRAVYWSVFLACLYGSLLLYLRG